MFHKELFKDQSSSHLVNYGWYFDYPKENTPTLEFSLHEKNEPRFQEILQTSISIQMQEGKRKGSTLGKRK
jgi:hypothetical protein